MAKITLTDGTIIEGTAEELIELQQATGTAEYSEEKSTEALKDSPQAETKDVRVGDYVVFDEEHIDTSAGKPYKVAKVMEDGVFEIIDDAEDEHWFQINGDGGTYKRYRPIEGAPQVGDKILVVNKRGESGEYGNGSVIAITKIHSTDRDFVYADEASLGLFRNEYIIIERAGDHIPQEPTTEIEVGDVVRVVGETYYGDIPQGTIVVVSAIDEVYAEFGSILLRSNDDFDRTSVVNLELIAKKADRKDLSRKDLAK